MVAIAHLAGAFVIFAFLTHIATTLVSLRRLRVPQAQRLPITNGPPVTIIRPVCGVEAHEEMALRSTFKLDYPRYEILFCCASADDPVVPLVERLLAEHPHVRTRLLIGDDHPCQNPKLNNVLKGWRNAEHEWIVIADSNVAMPRDYLQRLLSTWRPDTGLVSAPPIGQQPESVWAELECAYLNTYQARWQYAADALGGGFAQGKNMLWRRSDLEAAGGILALAREPAEDAAATKVVRGLGLKVHLADGAFPQPLGPRTAQQVWGRQVRWARLRRATFPGFFAMEILSGLAAPLACFLYAGWALDMESTDVLGVAGAYVGVWLAAEAWLAATLGWHLSWRSPLLWLLRELLLPALLIQAWLGKSLSWRGTHITGASDDVELRPGTLGS
ncbi:MAG TPA: ceramide glucosyltransferase [Hyphomicrobiaceae bacterium]|jgi:ceramide glucosyltransferase|nr:ceramide glucosyltransferase [Hyphomicrobiaceae bacterium]